MPSIKPPRFVYTGYILQQMVYSMYLQTVELVPSPSRSSEV